MAESWFGTIKVELLYRRIWRTRHEAQMEIFRWIEGWFGYAAFRKVSAGAVPWNTRPQPSARCLCHSAVPPVVGVRSFTEMRRNRAR
jgi:hypothetical protein